MIRRVVAAGCLLLGLISAPLPAWADSRPCVTYSVTAPVVGTKSGTKCSPVPTPDPVNYPMHYWDCTGVPPAGVEYCLDLWFHIPRL